MFRKEISMTEQEKKVLMECMGDSMDCTLDIVYETFAMLFETMAKHPSLSLQQMFLQMAITLRKLKVKKQ